MNQKQKRTLIIVAVVLVLALLAVGIWLAVRSGDDGEHQHSPILFGIELIQGLRKDLQKSIKGN